MKYFLITAVSCLTFMQSGCSLYQKISTQKSPAAVSSEPASPASSVSPAASECQSLEHEIDKARKRLNELELLSNSKQCH